MILLIFCGLALSGCSNLSAFLFYPQTHYFQLPEQLGLEAEQISIQTEDGEVLQNWYVKGTGSPKGAILFLHGNGENISTHINSVAWLPQHGYDIFLLDYRGYGKSTGASELSTALLDIQDAHQWLSKQNHHLPLYIFGQSMGGALAITYTANYPPDLRKIDALVSESAPASWPQIAREAMRSHWLTWLFQIPASLIPGKYDAEDHIAEITDIPILLMHSKQDTIVGFQHALQLRARSANNTQWLETQGNHTSGLRDSNAREYLLTFLASSSNTL